MKTSIKYILKVTIILAVGIFLVERLLTKNGFEGSTIEIIQVFCKLHQVFPLPFNISLFETF